MTKYATAVLNILCSLTSKMVFIINNESTIDFSQWSKTPTSIFTTKQFAFSLKELPNDFNVFLLDHGNNNVDQQRFATIDDLIFRLADEIIRMYRLEATKSSTLGDSVKAQEHDEQANRIYRELRNIDLKLTTKILPVKASDSTAPILIWLFSPAEYNEEDPNYIERT
jgi:hypothetical protein